jgi:hypothetical protein
VEELSTLYIPPVAVLPHGDEESSDGWIDGPFLRGPIPLDWLGVVFTLAGRHPLAVALAIWYLVGLRNRRKNLPFTTKLAARFGVCNRTAKMRALDDLESAGLIKVRRQQGKNPIVSIVSRRRSQTKDAAGNPQEANPT